MTSGVPVEPRGRRPRVSVSAVQLILADEVVVGLTALALVGVLPRMSILVLALALATFGAVLTVRIGRQRHRVRRLAAAVPGTEGRPVKGTPLPPAAAGGLIDELSELGFRVVGALDTTLPGRDELRTWILVEESGETWAEVGETARAMSVLLSETRGGRVVEASWPRGMRIDEPELLAAPASASLALTLADHRARAAAERRAEAALGVGPADPARPDGWRVRSFGDYLAWEPTQRARTGGMRLRQLLRTRIAPALRLAVGTLIAGVACSVALVAPWLATAGG